MGNDAVKDRLPPPYEGEGKALEALKLTKRRIVCQGPDNDRIQCKVAEGKLRLNSPVVLLNGAGLIKIVPGKTRGVFVIETNSTAAESHILSALREHLKTQDNPSISDPTKARWLY